MSYDLYSAVTTNTRDFRNNIFVNARSTTLGSNLHYAMYIVSTGGSITCDYNDYYVSGTGGTLGFYGANKSSLAIVTGQDANSLAIDPVFTNAGGTSPDDYTPTVSLPGEPGTGIPKDYNGATRSLTAPTMGAFEGGSCSNPTNPGTIAADQSGCSAFDPAAFTSSQPASGQIGCCLEYQWQKSITSGVAGFSDISGANSATYDAGPLIQTTWYKRLARVSCMPDWTGAVVSNVVKVTVNPLPDISLTVGGTGSVCSGTGTNITADGSAMTIMSAPLLIFASANIFEASVVILFKL